MVPVEVIASAGTIRSQEVLVSIIGSKITRGGRDWQVASTVRAGAGLRIIFRATDDPECKILARAPDGMVPENSADLSVALKTPESRWFRDLSGALWKVELKPVSGVGTPLGGWLLFASDSGAVRVRIRHDGLEGIGTLTDEELIKLLFQARQSSA